VAAINRACLDGDDTEVLASNAHDGGRASRKVHMSGTFQVAPDVVDDATYDLLQALTSKLEAIEAYEQYLVDGNGSIFSQLLEDERRHAVVLLDALRERLTVT
jgi:hypothetical protein